MKIFIYIALCFISIAIARICGFSEEAGLFGAILGGGAYIISIGDI